MPSAIESDDVVLGPNLAGETPASATTMQDGADRPNEKESPLSHARSKWRLGMLRDKQTDEVPGVFMVGDELLTKAADTVFRLGSPSLKG